MKNTITILCLFLTDFSNGTEFSRKSNLIKQVEKWTLVLEVQMDNTMSDEQRAQMNTRLTKQFQKTFVLTFDKTSSIFKEEKNVKSSC